MYCYIKNFNLRIFALLIRKPFRHFTYVTTHSPTLPLLHLSHSSFSNPSVVSPTSQLILQTLPLLYLRQSSFFKPFCCFTYVTAHSPNPSVALPTLQLILQTLPFLKLRQSSFSNPSFASPTSQALHLRHLASRLWYTYMNITHVYGSLNTFKQILMHVYTGIRISMNFKIHL